MRAVIWLFLAASFLSAQTGLPEGARSGEPTEDSILLQARVLDAVGVVRFVVESIDSTGTPWTSDALTPDPDRDFIVRAKVSGLRPATRYRWRLEARGESEVFETLGGPYTLRTLPAVTDQSSVRFVVTTCMNYEKFFSGTAPFRDDLSERERGYPACDAIRAGDPAFVVYAGDCVYYDQPRPGAKDTEAMRRHWHQQHALPRVRALGESVSGFWMKDDHDYRFNDCDNTRPLVGPTPEMGVRVFKEQVPVVPFDAFDAPTYRTRRVGKYLQLWFVEGRDYRSPNKMADGPEKTLWGKTQREWLQRTLLASDARFKVIVSPTPIVGPDDAYKADNHANVGGFRHEGEVFLAWAGQHGLLAPRDEQGSRNIAPLLWVCGDRHWQYHSVHPCGLHEISVGAHSDGNARQGRPPGDPKSTDPESLVDQRWVQPKPSGGYVEFVVTPGAVGSASLVANYRDDHGRLVHTVRLER